MEKDNNTTTTTITIARHTSIRYIIVYRHGERIDYEMRDNRNHCYHPSSNSSNWCTSTMDGIKCPWDPPLTIHGTKQATYAGYTLWNQYMKQYSIPQNNIEYIYTSPFLRCRLTSYYVRQGIKKARQQQALVYNNNNNQMDDNTDVVVILPRIRCEWGLGESLNESWYRSWCLPGSDGTWGYQIPIIPIVVVTDSTTSSNDTSDNHKKKKLTTKEYDPTTVHVAASVPIQEIILPMMNERKIQSVTAMKHLLPTLVRDPPTVLQKDTEQGEDCEDTDDVNKNVNVVDDDMDDCSFDTNYESVTKIVEPYNFVKDGGTFESALQQRKRMMKTLEKITSVATTSCHDNDDNNSLPNGSNIIHHDEDNHNNSMKDDDVKSTTTNTTTTSSSSSSYEPTIILVSHGGPVTHLYEALTNEHWSKHGESTYCCCSIYKKRMITITTTTTTTTIMEDSSCTKKDHPEQYTTTIPTTTTTTKTETKWEPIVINQSLSLQDDNGLQSINYIDE